MLGFITTVIEIIVDVITGIGRTDESSESIDPCNLASCIAAKEALEGERKTYNTICIYFKMLRSLLDTAAVVTQTPILLVAILLALAVLLPGPISVLIFALLAIYALSWYLVYVLGPVLAKVGEALLVQQTAVMEAISSVHKDCPDHCHGDTSLPECE